MPPKIVISVLIMFVSLLLVFVLVKQFPESFSDIRILISEIVPPPSEASKISIKGNHFYVNGGPFELRAVYYFQPNAYHSYFWDELNSTLMEEDFKNIKSQGFNAISVRVGWGSFVPNVDLSKKTYTINYTNEQKLLNLVDRAKSHGLYVLLWLDYSRLPEGINAKYYPQSTDSCGIKKSEFYGFLIPCIQPNSSTGGPVWNLLLEHYKRLAFLVKDADNLIWDPLDWQHLNLNIWSYADECDLQQWRNYLQNTSSSIDHWNERWNEMNNDWNTVLFPIDSNFKSLSDSNPNHPIGIVYKNVPVTSSNLNPKSKYKWEDFRKYQNEILINNTRDITAAIKSVDADAIIGQRIDRWRYNDWRYETWGVPGVDFIFEAYNPALGDIIAQNNITTKITERINRVRNYTNLPIYLSDCQMSTQQFTEEQQKDFFVAAYSAVKTLDLAGIGIWQWRETCFSGSADMGFGLMDRNGTQKLALRELVKLLGGSITCSDGTTHGSCSLIKPKYCENGVLIDKCSVCGCLPGYICQAAETQSCTPVCAPNWQCTSWNTCVNSQQTRTCTDSNSCGVTTNKPATTQGCTATCTPNWQCTSWNSCTNSQQTRTCTDSNTCGVTANKPTETQSCTVACTPNCTQKQCGSDGCNGSCGTCAAGSTCNTDGQCITPTPTTNIAQLQAQITQLLAQIAQLQTQLAKIKGTPQPFLVNLYYGLRKNSEVKRLQEFLIKKGYLGSGLNTGNYFSLTVQAVKAYQREKGITPVSGYFGPKTRKVVNTELGVE